jgi:hypothetical protein
MRGRKIAVATASKRRWPVALALFAFACAGASPAHASVGYELDPATPTLSLGANKLPHGLAVDQANRRLYVAVLLSNVQTVGPGEIRRFESDGTAAGTFTGGGGNAYFAGVAVDAATQGFFANEAKFESPFGSFGKMQMDPFTAAGAMGTPFALNSIETAPNIAIDSNSDIYFPNDTTNTVQVFSSTGAVEEEITCGDCPSGVFGRPVSVALDSSDALYVADLSPNRVVKLTLSGGTYAFDSVLHSGDGVAAVAVDPSTDDVLVGALPGGTNYHILAFDSAGSQFDDFGAGLFADPPAPLDARAAYQLAVDATSHELYAGTLGSVYIFDKVTSTPPAVTTNPASAIGQLRATLNATVNAKGHAVTACDFEYVEDADFQISGFANAIATPCSQKPNGSSNVAVSASIAGLAPSTKYHFRAEATSYAGSTMGNVQDFTTLAAVPPTVTADPATNVTQTTATLSGKVNPHGGAVTDCHFELGTSESYGSSVPCKTSIGPVTTEVTQKIEVKGLLAGTGYHFRLVVTSNAGSTGSDDATFTTQSEIAPPVEPQPAPKADPPPPPPPPPASPPPLTCRKGFVKKLVGGKQTCVRKCRKGTVRRRVQGKYKCVKPRRAGRANRRRPAPADRR